MIIRYKYKSQIPEILLLYMIIFPICKISSLSNICLRNFCVKRTQKNIERWLSYNIVDTIS